MEDNHGEDRPPENELVYSADAASSEEQTESAKDAGQNDSEDGAGVPWVALGVTAIVAAIAFKVGKKVIGSRKRGSKIRSSAFAKELVDSGTSYCAIVEANKPLSHELTQEDVREIADAVANEVSHRLRRDPEFRRFIREEATALKHTLPGHILASAVVHGITSALAAS